VKKQTNMLHLKLETDPRWATIVASNIEEILTDHAWCEQKAATNAITIITLNPEYPDLVSDLLELAKEELEHFEMVHNIIKKRGFKLGRERKDSYVNELYKFMNKGGTRLESMVDRLLFSAMIEARSCERFKLLSKEIGDPELSKFYYDLMVSEAGHYTTFITFARKYGKDINVDKRWKALVDFEGNLIKSYGTHESIHG
jgi:tRNA 2-(methylsulfanyl)-N6-isopentenyladenosine37 hydroxylase